MTNEHKISASLITSTRFLISFLLFIAILIQFTHKTDISVGILCMVNHTAVDKNNTDNSNIYNNKTNDVKCLFQNTSSVKNPDGPFLWNKNTQELILAAYFYGYLFSQVPGGLLSYKFGAKIVLFIGMLIGSIGTLLVPICANKNVYLLFICRFLTGFAQGTMWPAMMHLWTHWIPNSERGRLIAFSGSGSQMGVIFGFSLGGYLCVHGFDKGWPSIFYIFGLCGIIWCVIWMLLASDTPTTHRFISENEKNYIAENIHEEHNQKPLRIVLKHIFTSKTCISLFVQHFASTWCLSFFLTNMPTYIKEVLRFNVQSNGIFSSIPYALVTLVIILSGISADKLIESKRFKNNRIRKVFTLIALIGPALSLILLSFIKCDKPYLGVGVLTFGIAISGIGGGGYAVCYNDIAGSYAGLVFGISNGIAQLTGVIVPYTVAAITTNQTHQEWQLILIVSGVIMILGAIYAAIFGSCEAEPWALKEKTSRNINNEKYVVNDIYFY